jgi:hypothetical protein
VIVWPFLWSAIAVLRPEIPAPTMMIFNFNIVVRVAETARFFEEQYWLTFDFLEVLKSASKANATQGTLASWWWRLCNGVSICKIPSSEGMTLRNTFPKWRREPG